MIFYFTNNKLTEPEFEHSLGRLVSPAESRLLKRTIYFVLTIVKKVFIRLMK